jgi:hypothetical protein
MEHIGPYGARDIKPAASSKEEVGSRTFFNLWSRNLVGTKSDLSLAMFFHRRNAFAQLREEIPLL